LHSPLEVIDQLWTGLGGLPEFGVDAAMNLERDTSVQAAIDLELVVGV